MIIGIGLSEGSSLNEGHRVIGADVDESEISERAGRSPPAIDGPRCVAGVLFNTIVEPLAVGLVGGRSCNHVY